MTARIPQQMEIPPTTPKRQRGWWKRYAHRLERELMMHKATIDELRAKLEAGRTK